MQEWEVRLAYQGQQVEIESGEGDPIRGTLVGIDADGALRVGIEHGKSVTVHFGDVHLRPLT